MTMVVVLCRLVCGYESSVKREINSQVLSSTNRGQEIVAPLHYPWTNGRQVKKKFANTTRTI